MNEFLQIGIVGVALSFVVQYIKTRYGFESMTTKALTILLSLALGAGVYFLFGTPIWTSIVGVLTAATLFYSFIMK